MSNKPSCEFSNPKNILVCKNKLEYIAASILAGKDKIDIELFCQHRYNCNMEGGYFNVYHVDFRGIDVNGDVV